MTIQIKKVANGVFKVNKPYGNDLKPKTMNPAKVNPEDSSVSGKRKKPNARKNY